jgi:hypothetical protein
MSPVGVLRVRLVAVILAVGVGGLAAVAGAHPSVERAGGPGPDPAGLLQPVDPGVPVSPGGAAGAPLEWRAGTAAASWLPALLVLGAGLALAAPGASRRHRLVVCLVLVALVAFAAETTVHRLHHLHDPAGAAGCAAWGLGQQVTAALVDATPACTGSPVLLDRAAPDPASGYPRAAVTWLDLGRAPPHLPSTRL